jgi:hypothetical protein
MREQAIPDFRSALYAAPVGGMVLEFGVASGTSLKRICHLAAPRKVYGFDWFFGLPEDWNIYNPRGKFSTDGKLPEIPNNGVIISGLVQETLDKFLRQHDGYVAFAHMDMDLYSSTKYVLDRLAGRCVSGTVLLFDEIVDNQDHEEAAFLEFLANTGFDFEFVTRRNKDAIAFRLL